MLKRLSLPLYILCALLLLGCNKSETTNNNNSTMSNANKAMSRMTPATSSASPMMGSTGEKIGVPECDNFIAKYEACVSDKVPEMARASFKASIEQWRKAWRQAAATPQGKAGLAQACKAASEQARTTMKSYNCAF